MTINRHVSENSTRGTTMRQKLSASVLALALAFTSGCGLMNRQYMQSERETAQDTIVQVDAGASDADVQLPAGITDNPIPAAQDTQDPNCCAETRFNMHYNSTNFVDNNAEDGIADFVRSIAEQGHETLYIAGFASVENRGDRINNDAPYNDWLAEQRATRAGVVARDVIEQEGLDVNIQIISYAETDKLGSRLDDNRAVVISTRELPDIDEIANSAIAAEVRGHTPGQVYETDCLVEEVASDAESNIRLPGIDIEGRINPTPRVSVVAPVAPRVAPVAATPSEPVAPTYTPTPAAIQAPDPTTYSPTVRQEPAVAPARVQQTPEPVAPAPIVAPSGAIINFGVDPLAQPAAEPASDGFIESEAITVPPDYQGEQAPAVEPNETPAVPPASIDDLTVSDNLNPEFVPHSAETIERLRNYVAVLQGNMITYIDIADNIETECRVEGHGNSLCDVGYDAQCGADNNPRTPSELGETTVCREAYITLDQGLDIAQHDIEYIQNRIENMQTEGLPSTLEEAITNLSASVRGLEEAMNTYDVPVVPARYQDS